MSARRLPVSSAFYTCETILSCHMIEAGINLSALPPVQPPRLYSLALLDAVDGMVAGCVYHVCERRFSALQHPALRKCAFARGYHVMSCFLVCLQIQTSHWQLFKAQALSPRGNDGMSVSACFRPEWNASLLCHQVWH